MSARQNKSSPIRPVACVFSPANGVFCTQLLGMSLPSEYVLVYPAVGCENPKTVRSGRVAENGRVVGGNHAVVPRGCAVVWHRRKK